MAKAKKKYKKRRVEKWGGRELRGVINGKIVEVKLDPDTRTYYYNPPMPSGKGRKRQWLYASKKRSAEEFLDVVEKHNRRRRRKELPRGTVKAERLLPNITQLPYEMDDEFAARREYLLNEYMDGGIAQMEGETDDEYRERVLTNPHIPWRYKYSVPEQVLVAML